MVIGIGGVSRSGKSTLANLLAAHFRKNGKKVLIFHQDDFVLPDTMIPKIKHRLDWESPLSIDHNMLAAIVRDFKDRVDIVIVEGLFAFFEPQLESLYDKRILVKISKRTFLIRKGMDNRWGYEPTWYINHIWQSFLKFGQPTEPKTAFLLASGEDEFDLKKIFNYLTPTSKKSNIYDTH
ncbi:MAG: uridine kinase [Spirosomataceae bacterium]